MNNPSRPVANRQNGMIFLTLFKPTLVTQMLVPSNATPTGPSPIGLEHARRVAFGISLVGDTFLAVFGPMS